MGTDAPDARLFRDGRLLDVIGRAARFQDYLFVPVLMELTTGPRVHRLGEFLADACPCAWDEQADEALWVRARVGKVFGFTPLSSISRMCLLDVPFLAVKATSRLPFLEMYPFVCTDSDGDEPVDYEDFDESVGLAFAPSHHPDPGEAAQIAECFWGLLLADPGDLAVFCDYFLSQGGEFLVGCDGLATFVETAQGVDFDPDFGDGWNGEGHGYLSIVGKTDPWACPDCDGEGVEFFADLVEQACETCRGSGFVSWPRRLVEGEEPEAGYGSGNLYR